MTKIETDPPKFLSLPKLQQNLRMNDTSPETIKDTSLLSISKDSLVQNSVSLSKDFT